MKYLSRLKPALLRGKVILLRTDFNIENVRDSLRLESSLPTLQFLKKAGARIVIFSHRGRPKKNKRSRGETLRVVLPFLEKHLQSKIAFFSHFDFKKIHASIKNSAPGGLFLLENLRFLEGEEANDSRLGKALASLGDIYINDAFAVSHREDASITQIPKLLPSYGGLLFQKEIETLGALSKNPEKPFVIILGGAKASDKIAVIERFLPHASAILLGGVPANTFLKARGFDIGSSPFESSMLPRAKQLLKNKHIVLPIDFISDKDRLLDIGPETLRLFIDRVSHAKTILWNGPLGFFEDARFSKGSEAFAKAISKLRTHSIVGGGETTTLMQKLNLEKKISFLSTGGGAMLEFLAGEKLPGIEALQ